MTNVSIIITTHNRPHLLARAVESAQAASRRGVEVIIVDDASTDDNGDKNADIGRRFQDVKYVRIERNQGVAGARNVGILASRGEYLSFLDDDDVRLEGSLDKQVDALDSAPEAGLVYGQAILGAEDGSRTDSLYPERCPDGDVFWELLSQNFVPCGTALFRRSCLSRIGLLDPGISGIDDWDLWVRIAELYPVLSQERPLMIWRKSTPVSGQGTSNAIRIVELSTRRFHNNWMSLQRVKRASARKRKTISRKFSDNMAKHLLWEAMRPAAAGHLLRSPKNILAAIRLCPTGVARAFLRMKNFRSLLTHVHKEREALKAAHAASKRACG
ncbi:MAG TPA: glycosyltransferase family A protein [Pyrinomonadaceae bacterium]|nr:glycosyltransferase family A protein [Pyrinomonadaceae bacterium]